LLAETPAKARALYEKCVGSDVEERRLDAPWSSERALRGADPPDGLADHLVAGANHHLGHAPTRSREICHASSVLMLSGISKTFGARRALADVSLEVKAGEAVLLVGRNGAGKTTLLRIATGFLDPDAGTVEIDGLALDRERTRAQRRLGYLPEHAPAPAELAVRAHLYTRARLKGVRDPDAIARAMQAAAMEGEGDRRIGTLSKGFRQRVGLADALLGEPPLLVLDEPTSGMDPIQTRELRAHLIEAARQRAVIVSSHAVTDLEALATRVAVLRAGELVADDTPEALRARTGAATLEAAVVALLGEEAAA
jgi:ABC-2 type transport system ATP-binding protein